MENLLEHLRQTTRPVVQTIDNECQIDDRQHEKLVVLNNKLKTIVQGFKDKINRVINDRSNLFDGIGTDINDRLERLISILENQTEQINHLQNECEQTKERSVNEIEELQK